MLAIKRIYDIPSKEDGYRILVDRLWPRGISKIRAKLYRWAKEITPSTELRQSFHSEKDTFGVFKKEYVKELNRNSETKHFIAGIKALLEKGNVTFLTSSKDPKENHVVVLKSYVEKKLS